MHRVHARPWQLLALALSVAFSSLHPALASDEEFNGPFPSWRDVKRDYGAVGDGKTDDTLAIQRGLDELQHHETSVVLYVPAGTYRLTQTLKTHRAHHTDCMGISLVGEDPAKTSFVWDGAEDQPIVQWDAWYSCFSRLTLDGANKANIGLQYGPGFSTNNQTNDLIFRNVKTGLLFGGQHYQGQAENEVLRCQFLGCQTGIMTAGWNSMDIWIWYCRFEDCDRGVHNVMGNWHCWQSLFLRSKTSDLSIRNLMAFSIVNNTSIGSKCFMDFNTGHSWGSPTSVTGNRIINPTDTAIQLSNAGPYLIVDNQFRLKPGNQAIALTWGDQTLVGNAYSQPDAVDIRGRYRRIEEKVVPAEQISSELPSMPATPPHVQRPVIEVAAGANAEAIQHAIDQAVELNGKRPIVHLPMGAYPIVRTLTIPAGCDVQLLGDGSGETATRLNWGGSNGGVLLRLAGPSHATLSDLFINAGSGRALLADHADQPSGQIFAEELNVSGPTSKRNAENKSAALRIAGFKQTNVLLRALQGSGNNGSWVQVVGDPSVATPQNQVSIFTGATGSAAGQYDVRDNGSLVVRSVYHERSSDALSGLSLTGSGSLCIDATRFSYATSASAPTIEAENFHGLFTLATCMLMPVETQETCRFQMRGDCTAASLLALGDQFTVYKPGTTSDTIWLNQSHPRAGGGLVGCNINTSNKDAAPRGFEFLPSIGENPDPAKSPSGAGPLEDRGGVDDATLLRHLAPLRAAKVWLPQSSAAADVTDLRLHRIMATGNRDGAVELRGE